MVGGRVSYFYYYLASLLLFRLKTPAPGARSWSTTFRSTSIRAPFMLRVSGLKCVCEQRAAAGQGAQKTAGECTSSAACFSTTAAARATFCRARFMLCFDGDASEVTDVPFSTLASGAAVVCFSMGMWVAYIWEAEVSKGG